MHAKGAQHPSRSWRQRLAAWVAGSAGKPRASRSYAAARATRTTGGFGSSGNSTADAELHGSLTQLRARSRQMVRDSSFAKRARDIVVNNVIGSGMGMQAQVETTRGALSQRVNDEIEAAFARWSTHDSCHTGGALQFGDFERAAMAQVFETGEAFVRLHMQPFGRSRVPLALELIEAERIADSYMEPAPVAQGHELRMGVEVDRYGRAVAYWVRQRAGGDIRPLPNGLVDNFERVPADAMLHLRRVTRWPQTRGEPWLHTALRKIDDLNEYTQLEVLAARGSAAYFATIETEGEPPHDDEEADGRRVVDLEPLTIQGLEAGQKLHFHTPNRPNSALDPFVRAMLREIASGAGTSYESLSRDYSQSNYSSSRLALLDDRDGWKALQQWWIRAFREPLHKLWIQQAVLARELSAVPVAEYAQNPAKFEAVRFKPRGWSWIDPTKEVEAYKEAIRAGLTTTTDVIAATADGRDIEDVIRTRRRELDMLEAADVEVDTSGAPAPTAATPPRAQTPPDDEDDDDDDAAAGRARVLEIRRTAA